MNDARDAHHILHCGLLAVRMTLRVTASRIINTTSRLDGPHSISHAPYHIQAPTAVSRPHPLPQPLASPPSPLPGPASRTKRNPKYLLTVRSRVFQTQFRVTGLIAVLPDRADNARGAG